jgi:hypothetical protein
MPSSITPAVDDKTVFILDECNVVNANATIVSIEDQQEIRHSYKRFVYSQFRLPPDTV